MTDEFTIPAGMPENDARAAAADLVKAGIPIESVNPGLTAQGFAPLNADAAAQAALDHFKATSGAKLFSDNPGERAAAMAQFNLLTAKAQLSKGGTLTDAPVKAQDLRFPGVYRQDLSGAGISAADMEKGLADVSAGLNLSAQHRGTLQQLVIEAIDRERTIPADQRESHGEAALERLKRTLGKDADAQLAEASKTLAAILPPSRAQAVRCSGCSCCIAPKTGGHERVAPKGFRLSPPRCNAAAGNGRTRYCRPRLSPPPERHRR